MSRKELSIVTGASRGIGKAIALRLASEKHDVMIFGRDISALESVRNEILSKGAECEYFSGDAGDQKFVDRSVKEILDKYGNVDHLINNAGMGILKMFVDSNLNEFKEQVNVNIFGVYNFTKAVIPSMIENKKGTVINIASLAGKNAFKGGTMYSATKHAVLGFSKSLMLEVREYNVKVAAVCPGSVDTEFFTTAGVQKTGTRLLTPSDVAEVVMTIINLPPNALLSEVDLRPTNP